MSKMFGLLCNNEKKEDEEKAFLSKCDSDENDDDDVIISNQDGTNEELKDKDEDGERIEEGQSSNSQTSFHVLNLIQGALFSL